MEREAGAGRTGERAYAWDEKLWKETERRIWYFAWHPEQIEGRLRELDEEWDIERMLEANASTFALGGLLLGMAFRRRYFLLPIAVSGFLMQHSLQGRCLPVTLLRRLGLRTRTEIEAERYALKALRGDFRGLGEPASEVRAEEQPAGRVVQAIVH